MVRMSWVEIKKTYPNQWVGLSEVSWNDEANIEAAVVKYSEKDANELTRMQVAGEDVLAIFTTPENAESVAVLEVNWDEE